MIDLDKMEALAKAATQGKWESRVSTPANGEHGEFWLVSKSDLNLALGITIFDSTDIDSRENAAYIEAAQPANVLALIAEVRALREDAERYDFLKRQARCDPKMDGRHVWWNIPMRNPKGGSLIGNTLDEAIDDARK